MSERDPAAYRLRFKSYRIGTEWAACIIMSVWPLKLSQPCEARHRAPGQLTTYSKQPMAVQHSANANFGLQVVHGSDTKVQRLFARLEELPDSSSSSAARHPTLPGGVTEARAAGEDVGSSANRLARGSLKQGHASCPSGTNRFVRGTGRQWHCFECQRQQRDCLLGRCSQEAEEHRLGRLGASRRLFVCLQPPSWVPKLDHIIPRGRTTRYIRRWH